MKIAKEPVSLETPIGDEDDTNLGDFIQAHHFECHSEFLEIFMIIRLNGHFWFLNPFGFSLCLRLREHMSSISSSNFLFVLFIFGLLLVAPHMCQVVPGHSRPFVIEVWFS